MILILKWNKDNVHNVLSIGCKVTIDMNWLSQDSNIHIDFCLNLGYEKKSGGIGEMRSYFFL